MALHICFADFELDEARFELRRNGEVVAVQPKVLELLLYLARNRDRVVPKDELFDEVWAGTVVTEASLSHAVSLARKALGDTPKQELFVRTVRRKGLQFVAEVRAADTMASVPAAPRAGSNKRVSTLMETAQETAKPRSASAEEPRLYVLLHGESPELGGASWSLSGVDEVSIGRGSSRRSERTSGVTELLALALPDRLLSREHARLVRTPEEWMLVDGGSRNGTFLNDERIEKHGLQPGDVFRCGRTFLRFVVEVGGDDVDVHPASDNLLCTVTPELLSRASYLERVAPATLPLLFIGPSGAGKTHLCERIHAGSGRSGKLVRIEAGTLAQHSQRAHAALASAGRGTVIVENVERVDDDVAPILASMLDEAHDARVLGTSIATYDELQERIPKALLTRLAGHRSELPPLSERMGDFGALVASLLAKRGLAIELDAEAAQALIAHGWPGNLRELGHTLESAARLAAGEKVRLAHLPQELR